jgi:hypothetical protein
MSRRRVRVYKMMSGMLMMKEKRREGNVRNIRREG